MRFKLSLLSLLALTGGVLATGLAAAAVPKQIQAQQPAPKAAAPQKAAMVKLYAAPELTAKLVASVRPNAQLVPIIQKGQWIKVGNSQNGVVGWINRKQYRQAQRAWYRPNIQTVYIQNTAGKDGKPEMNIVAYSNGKKLNAKQAKALYKRMQVSQQRNWRSMDRFDRRMDRYFARQDRMMDRMFDSGPMMGFDDGPNRPIIVINQPAPPAPPVKGNTAAKAPDQQTVKK